MVGEARVGRRWSTRLEGGHQASEARGRMLLFDEPQRGFPRSIGTKKMASELSKAGGRALEGIEGDREGFMKREGGERTSVGSNGGLQASEGVKARRG